MKADCLDGIEEFIQKTSSLEDKISTFYANFEHRPLENGDNLSCKFVIEFVAITSK